jgi:GNAT superfamily N-acetyltransferase
MVSVLYNFVRSRQLEGSFDEFPEKGVYPITSLRISKGWGFPPEELWPYKNGINKWPPDEPEDIDRHAKVNRIGIYQRVVGLSDCKKVLAQGMPVSVSLEIFRQWFNAVGGKIQMPAAGDENSGNHMVVLLGFDEDSSSLCFANSWGKEWGDKGYGTLSYEYFEAFSIESWLIHPLISRSEKTLESGITITNFGVKGIPDGTVHVVELCDTVNDDTISWAFAVEKAQNFLEVEEVFVKPDYRYRGYGTTLVEELSHVGEVLGLPLQFWVTEVDGDRDNLYGLEKICAKLNLQRSAIRSAGRSASFSIWPKN